jgi:RNA polymerase sigma-70 factor (ECF subfamily)
VARAEPRSSRTPEIDPEVLGAAVAGEHWAFKEIVRFYQRLVHAVVWRMLGSPGRRGFAEDVTQDAFLRAFRSLPRFDVGGRAPFSAWLVSITVRTAIDELRRRRPEVASLDLIALSPSMGARPDEAAEWASTARAVRAAADDLAPEIRAAFVLRAYHEFSYAEIAQALGVDLGTVKSRLHRARRALVEHLGEFSDD